MADVELVTIDIGGSIQEPLLDKPNPTRINRVADVLSSPKTILIISGIYLTGYITFIGKEGGFTSQFLQAQYAMPRSASGPGGVFTLGEPDCPPGLFPMYLRELCLDRSRSHLQRPS